MREELFERLRTILADHRDRLSADESQPGRYVLQKPGPSGKPEFVAAVEVKKSYVAYHLFPVYTNPTLLHGISAPLRARMQGKSCFNFKKVEPELLAELDALTARALAET